MQLWGNRLPLQCVTVQVARKHGWRPQAASQAPSHPKPLSPKPSSTSTQSPTQPQALHSPTRSSAQPGVAPAGAATAETASHGSDALQSAEAAAARASQIAESVVAAGAAAEEAVADAEDYETASRYAQELLGSLGKPKASAAGGKRFYGEACIPYFLFVTEIEAYLHLRQKLPSLHQQHKMLDTSMHNASHSLTLWDVSAVLRTPSRLLRSSGDICVCPRATSLCFMTSSYCQASDSTTSSLAGSCLC